MLFNSYLRKSVVYVPTVVKLQTGHMWMSNQLPLHQSRIPLVCAARSWTRSPEKTLSFLRHPRISGRRLFY